MISLKCGVSQSLRVLATTGRRGATSSIRRNFSNFTGVIGGTLARDGPVVGAYASCDHKFTQEAVNDFAKICGDNNPLHIDPAFASGSMFNGPIVHGILVSSLFSTLFGRSLHGSIYVSQSLKFRAPVHVGAPIHARMEIIKKESKRKGFLLTCSTQVYVEDTEGSRTLAISGEACTLLPFDATPK